MTSPHRRFKDTLFEQFARIGKALSAPARLELLELLSQGPRTVEALAGQTSLSVANASRHLQVLRAARLVDAEKRGQFVEYRLASDEVAGVWLSMRRLGERQLAEVEQVTRAYFKQRGALEPVASGELLRRVQEGRVTVLDVRPREEFDAAHIPGAISMPVAEIEARIDELPKRRAVVAYCRGPYCVMALEAVELLRERGYAAQRMEQGVLEWRAREWRVSRAKRGAIARASDA